MDRGKFKKEEDMKKGLSFLLALGLVLVIAGPLTAHVWLVGFSGAPGTYGVCSRSCHCYPGGTLSLKNFPDHYQPGHTYTISVTHIAGDSVENFNCSVRKGQGTENAGLLEAGYLTEIYSDSVETNGVHALQRCDSCDFLWTAPPVGTDTVRLYFGGMQGYEGEWGRNTEYILTAPEFTGVEEQASLQPKSESFDLRLAGANPARNGVALAYRLDGKGPAQLRVYDLAGRLVRSFAVRGSSGVLRWDGRDAQGALSAPGVYLVRLEQGNRSSTGKAVLIR